MSQLNITIKAEDRLREWLSKRGSTDGLQLSFVALGDSDVDYEMSLQSERISTVPSAYQIPQIKYKLLYEGNPGNFAGEIVVYSRYVDQDGNVGSLYSFPPNNLTYTLGVSPPTLGNGYNQNSILFNTLNANAEGYIVYLQTLPDGYVDETTGDPLRLQEVYSIVFTGLPVSWEVILDEPNGSFLIARPAGYTFTSGTGTIEITGNNSSIKRTLTFNY